MIDSIAVALHALAAAIWVGGMFLVYVCLRPVVHDMDPQPRLKLMAGVFGKFFPWVMMAVVVLLATGYYLLMVTFGGFAGAGVHIHIMHLIGLIMFALFLHLYFAPWRRMRAAVAAEDWTKAGAQVNTIRIIVLVNLTLGLATVAIGSSGRYWP